MASSSKCSIGKKTATECNKTFYVKSIGEIAFSELSDADLSFSYCKMSVKVSKFSKRNNG